jgi:hypothetical protein
VSIPKGSIIELKKGRKIPSGARLQLIFDFFMVRKAKKEEELNEEKQFVWDDVPEDPSTLLVSDLRQILKCLGLDRTGKVNVKFTVEGSTGRPNNKRKKKVVYQIQEKTRNDFGRIKYSTM